MKLSYFNETEVHPALFARSLPRLARERLTELAIVRLLQDDLFTTVFTTEVKAIVVKSSAVYCK